MQYSRLEDLVILKFTIEKQINTNKELLSNVSNNLNIRFISDKELINKIILYQFLTTKTLNQLLMMQTDLLINIENILYRECQHEWVTDIVEEPLERERTICYCSKCLIYKKK